MKSMIKSKIILLLISLSFVFSLFLSCGGNIIRSQKNANLGDCEGFTAYEGPLSASGASARIHIDDNWTIAKDAGFCTGNGTFSKPYIIKDLIIDGGGLGSCILIENSEAYFEIKNCTLYNSGEMPNGAIRLINVTKGVLKENNCSFGERGLTLSNCSNITVSGNVVNDNYWGISVFVCNDVNISENTVYDNNGGGIFVSSCYNITILRNTANDNKYFGIKLSDCDSIKVSENIMNECSITIRGTLEQLKSYNISTTNSVNGKPLYYYKNELNLKPNHFLDAGQVILVNCNNSLLSNLVISSSDSAISLYYCYNNTISGNVANNNTYGLELNYCVGNIISGNFVNDNQYGIALWNCHNDTISGNIVSNNYWYGIQLVWCHDIVVRGNIASYNRYGIFLDIDYRNTISGNIANNNSYYGIYIYYSNLNIILGNFANENSEAGIFVDNSDHNTISENTANNNLFYGIQLLGSNYNTISGNTLLGNAECIYEENCQGNKFNDNGECTYGQEEPGPSILGYSIIVLLGVFSFVTIFLLRKINKLNSHSFYDF